MTTFVSLINKVSFNFILHRNCLINKPNFFALISYRLFINKTSSNLSFLSFSSGKKFFIEKLFFYFLNKACELNFIELQGGGKGEEYGWVTHQSKFDNIVQTISNWIYDVIRNFMLWFREKKSLKQANSRSFFLFVKLSISMRLVYRLFMSSWP